jgi:hypothetical protein
MNYKLTTILLALVVIGLLIKPYFEDSSKPREDPITIQEPTNRENQVDYSKVNWPKIDISTGDFISPDAAHMMLNDYHARRRASDGNYDPENEIYGFTFGREKVRELLTKMDAFNKDNTDPKEEIIALRVYYGWKMDTVLNTEHNDVFMIPVKRDSSKNIYPIDDNWDKDNSFVENSMILNMSLPCPTKCDP